MSIVNIIIAAFKKGYPDSENEDIPVFPPLLVLLTSRHRLATQSAPH